MNNCYRTLLMMLAPALLLAMAPAAFAQEPELKAENQQDFVSDVFPYPLDEVHDRAQALFNSDARDYYEDYNAKIYDLPEPVANYKDLSPRAYKRFMAFPLVRPNKFYVFYGAYATMQNMVAETTPLTVMGHANPALQRYAQLPQEQRAQDFYIWSPDTPFWHSEYEAAGKPLPFRAYFILHLAPVDDDHTRVEVIEDQPVVRMGRKMSVDANGRVHYDDIREVEPTTRDREFLLSCVRQFMDRHVPGRHWFSCRDKDEKVEIPIPFTVP